MGRAVAWIKRWGISFCSLSLGLTTLLVFRRGLPHVSWIVGYLLLLVLLVAAVAELRGPLEDRGRRLVLSAADYAVQTLYHGLLLFVLPAYWASATFDSRNVIFLVGVIVGALVTAVDPWYAALVQPRRWLNRALLAFSIFAALNVALPLLRLRPIFALEPAAALTAGAQRPMVRERGRRTRREARGGVLRGAGGAVLAAALAGSPRGLGPPAPLFGTRPGVARSVPTREPIDPTASPIPAAIVADWGGLAAYTAVYVPAGLEQGIEHVWWKDGRVLGHIALSPVRGGRKEGFRTYSRKVDLRPPYQGRYRVDAMTASGQLIGRLRFT